MPEDKIERVMKQVTVSMNYNNFKESVVRLVALGVAKKDLVKFINNAYNVMEEEYEGQLNFNFEED
jgi:hypothetical protein